MEVVIFVVGLSVGWIAWTWWKAKVQHEQMLDEAVQEVLRKMVTTKLEVHQGCFYLFREDNDTFVAQGHNAQELLAHINLRFRHMKFFITQGDQQVINSLQQQLDSLGDQSPIQNQ